MKEVLLINCPPWGTVMPPLGPAYIAAFLKAKGIPVTVGDLNLELYLQAGEQRKWLWDLGTINTMPPEDIARRICADFAREIRAALKSVAPFTVIGFSANNLISAVAAGIIAKQIKELFPEKIIVAGGPGCYHSWDREKIPHGAIDFFVIGEGEEAFYRLLIAVDGNACSPGLPALPGVLAANGKSRMFLPARQIDPLDCLPFPTFEEFALRDYNRGQRYRPLPVLASRGCINRCSYCIDWYMSCPFRCRSASAIVGEIEHHRKRYGITHVEFNDLLCNGNLRRLEELCDGLAAKDLDVRWISYAVVRADMNARLLEKMKTAGCTSLCYGMESASDRVLGLMRKRYTAGMAAEVLRRTHEAGIQARLNIIVGFPGETEDDFQQTLSFLSENRRYIGQVTNISAFVLMPNADVGIYPHRFGITFPQPHDPGIWTDENGLTPAERNRRVERVRRALADMGIDYLIVNEQKSAVPPQPPAAAPLSVRARGAAEPVCFVPAPPRPAGRRARRSAAQNIKRRLLFALLLPASFAVDFYLMLLKKLRGSVIFPGS